jgi:hypothetical protein
MLSLKVNATRGVGGREQRPAERYDGPEFRRVTYSGRRDGLVD